MIESIKNWVINYHVNNRPNVDIDEENRVRENYFKSFEEYDTDEKFYAKISALFIQNGYDNGLRKGYHDGYKEGLGYSGGDTEKAWVGLEVVLEGIEQYWKSSGYDEQFVDFLFDFLKVFRDRCTQEDKEFMRVYLEYLRENPRQL
ncbi:MAG: hypothetical protein IPF79_02565 [Ignavibacteria bacterium]|nr:hypothetical protein [Ignavibacteria bacterium]